MAKTQGLEVDRGLCCLVRLACKDKDRPNLKGVSVRPGKDGDAYTVTDGRRLLTVTAKPGHGNAGFDESVVGVEDWKAGLAHVATDKEAREAHPTVTMEVVDGTVIFHNLGGETRSVTVEGELVSGTFPSSAGLWPEYANGFDASGLNAKDSEAYAVEVNPSLLAGLLKVMSELSDDPVLLHVPRNPHSAVMVTGRFGDGEMRGLVMPFPSHD